MPKPRAKIHPPQLLLNGLQRFVKNSKKIKEIHSLLTINGHLLVTSRWSNTLLYNCLIRAYLSLSQPQTAFILFRYMLAHNAPPNKLTFPSLIKSATSLLPPLAFVTGLPLRAQTLKRGVSNDPFVQTSFVSLYAHLGDLDSAREVFDEILQPCVVSCNAMLDAFGKNGDMGSAVLMFSRMSGRDVYSWTSVINGYAKNGRFGEAIGFFGKMMVDVDVIGGVLKPNEATFVSVLSSCSNFEGGRALYHGKQIHGYMVKNENYLSVFMGTALIAFYGKMGCFEYAHRLFGMMVIKEVCTWNAMISSLALNGRETDALDMFMMMKSGGCCPNVVTFVGVLSACARAKLVDLGLEFFHSMQCQFGIVPRMEHYGCVVDLLGRAGLLHEAYEFMQRMPFEADASVLGALLGACRIHGATEMANEVGQRLFKLQPQHCGRYVQLSSIYAGEERWVNAAALRKLMMDAGIRKLPAYSIIYRQ